MIEVELNNKRAERAEGSKERGSSNINVMELYKERTGCATATGGKERCVSELIMTNPFDEKTDRKPGGGGGHINLEAKKPGGSAAQGETGSASPESGSGSVGVTPKSGGSEATSTGSRGSGRILRH